MLLKPHQVSIWFLVFILVPTYVFSSESYFIPISGVDTTDSKLDIPKLIYDDDNRDNYKLDFRNDNYYWEDLYQEYNFNFSTIPPMDNIDSVKVFIQFKENKLGGAKLEIWDGAAWTSYPLDVSVSENLEINNLTDVSATITSDAILELMKVRFLAYGKGKGVKAQIDLIWVIVTHSRGKDTLYLESQGMAPSTVVSGQTDVLMNDLSLSVNNIENGQATLTDLEVHFYGDDPSHVLTARIWLDNGDGVFSASTDTTIGEAPFIGSTASVNIVDTTIFYGSLQHLFVTCDISPLARLGKKIGLTFLLMDDFQVLLPDQVTLTTTMESGLSTLIDPVTENILVVNNFPLAPSFASRGSEDVVMQLFSFDVLGSGDGIIFLDKISLTFTGSYVNDISPQGVKIYHDVLFDGIYDPDQDILLGSADIVGTTAVVDIVDFIVNPGGFQAFIVTLDIDRNAYPGHYVETTIISEADIQVKSPDSVQTISSPLNSGKTIITGNTWSDCANFDYTISKYLDFHEFNIYYLDYGFIYGRVHEDIFGRSFPSFDNNNNEYKMRKMFIPGGTKRHKLTGDAPLVYVEPYWQFGRSYVANGWYSVEFKLKNKDRGYTVEFRDGVKLDSPVENFYIDRKSFPIQHEHMFRPQDVVSIRIDTSLSSTPIDNVFDINEVKVFDLTKNTVYWDIATPFVQTGTPGEYIATIVFSEANGFYANNVYWFENRLRDVDQDEFIMNWVFGICKLDECSITGYDQAAPTVDRGSTDNYFLRVDLESDFNPTNGENGEVILTGITIEYKGTSRMDIPTNGIKVYQDVGIPGVFEPGVDILLGQGDFRFTNKATINFIDGLTVMYPTRQSLLITLDISATAKLGNFVQISMENEENYEILVPDRVKIVAPPISKSSQIVGIPVTGSPTLTPTNTPTVTPTPTSRPTYTPTLTPTPTITPTATVTPTSSPTILATPTSTAYKPIPVINGYIFTVFLMVASGLLFSYWCLRG